MPLNSLLISSYNFNSIKVRLKLVHFFTQSDRLPFQFHKGTIKTTCLQSLCSSLNHFNSIKVRLKLNTDWGMSVYVSFQFHKGTIKTHKSGDDETTYVWFQFHKGTIKTPLPEFFATALWYFNSIKVRLKPDNIAQILIIYIISIP